MALRRAVWGGPGVGPGGWVGRVPGSALDRVRHPGQSTLATGADAKAIRVDPVFVAIGLGIVAAVIVIRVLSLRPRPTGSGASGGDMAVTTVESAAS